MKNKLKDSILRFYGSFSQKSGSLWTKQITERVIIQHLTKPASLSLKWVPRNAHKGVIAIAISGRWNVTAIKTDKSEIDDIIKEENIYQVPYSVK